MKTKSRPVRENEQRGRENEQRLHLAAASRHHGQAPAGNSVLIAAELGAARCRWCNDDLEHCHESLVVHAVGEMHCMGVKCTTPPELHHMVVDCSDFGCTCAESASAQAVQRHAG